MPPERPGGTIAAAAKPAGSCGRRKTRTRCRSRRQTANRGRRERHRAGRPGAIGRVNPSKFLRALGQHVLRQHQRRASFTASARRPAELDRKVQGGDGTRGDILDGPGDPGGPLHSTNSGARSPSWPNVAMADNIVLRARRHRNRPTRRSTPGDADRQEIHGLFPRRHRGGGVRNQNDGPAPVRGPPAQATTATTGSYGACTWADRPGNLTGDIAGAPSRPDDFGLRGQPAAVSVATGSSSATANQRWRTAEATAA